MSEAFLRVAKQYCAIIDSHPGAQRRKLLVNVHQLLPELYAAGLRLPLEEDIEFNESEIERTMSTDEAMALTRSLNSIIGAADNYREIFDPYDPADEEPVVGSLSDDLTDIYRDLSRGVGLWEQGRHAAAVWDWRFHFDCHWGEHVAGALRAMHSLGEKEGFAFSRRDV